MKSKAAANSSYKKLAVQWLNEALCFVSSFVVADRFSASKSPTSCSCKTLPASVADDPTDIKKRK